MGPVGRKDGRAIGLTEGLLVGPRVGESVGGLLGGGVQLGDFDIVGEEEGVAVVGTRVGWIVGWLEGGGVQSGDFDIVGVEVGCGVASGAREGWDEGSWEGLRETPGGSEGYLEGGVVTGGAT